MAQSSKKLINCSNLHVGGGVQVATSFIEECITHDLISDDYDVWMSSEVANNLEKRGVDISLLPNADLVDSYGMKLFGSPLVKRMQAYKTVFTVFGPLYVGQQNFNSIVGFAQPWILYPNAVTDGKGLIGRLLTKLKFSLQLQFFKRADHLIVELEHAKDVLVSERNIATDNISIVRNCPSAVYRDMDTIDPACQPQGRSLNLGFLGRDYAHKNTKVFPEVAKVLQQRYGIAASFKVTFTEEEWQATSEEFKDCSENVGLLRVDQCPGFYQSVDAVIFPSLLECFSATPVEAMAMKRPIFLSDRRFNRDVCGQYGYYFDPHDPEDIAKVIAEQYTDMFDNIRLEAASEFVKTMPGASERARRYIECIDSI